MTTTPADELRVAAEKLRDLLTHPQLTAGPWLCLDHGDRLLRNQPGDEDRAPVYVVNEPMSNGANATYIATMHPAVGAALADWLDQEAGRLTATTHPDWQETVASPHALTIARTINQEQT